MRPWLLIGADLAREAALSPSVRIVIPFLAVLLPLQQGFVDGLSPVPFVSVRLCLSASAMMPSVAMLGIFLEVLLPRKLGGALEPLLAAPVRDRDLVLGHALPLVALQAGAVAAGIPLAFAGYRLGAGRWPPEPLSDAAFMGMAGIGVGLITGGAAARALMAASGAGSFSLRTVPVLAALVPLDVVLVAMRFAGYGRATLVVPAALVCAGAVILRRAMRSLDRGSLLMR